MNTPDKHRLKIARDTLRMSSPMVAVMGGMTRQQAIDTIIELTGEYKCPHPPTRIYTWFVGDILCAGCCDCGAVLAGGVP